jgi:hypothetical protein
LTQVEYLVQQGLALAAQWLAVGEQLPTTGPSMLSWLSMEQPPEVPQVLEQEQQPWLPIAELQQSLD